eukprot:evm.model.NODE_7421_length_28612_cov_28.772577.14
MLVQVLDLLILLLPSDHLGDEVVIGVDTDFGGDGHGFVGDLLGVHVVPVQ